MRHGALSLLVLWINLLGYKRKYYKLSLSSQINRIVCLLCVVDLSPPS